MEFVILIIVAFFGWAALRGILRGKVGSYHQNYRESEKVALAKANAGEADHPSWSADNDKMQTFTHGIRKLMDREGISDEARRTMFQEEHTRELILAHAANMERNGASFVEQQMGSCDLAIKIGKEVDLALKSGTRFVPEAEKANQSSMSIIEGFLEEYDRSGELQHYFAIAVWSICKSLVDKFGGLEGFRSAQEDEQVRFLSFHGDWTKETQQPDGEEAHIENRSLQFVANILLLTVGESEEDRPASLTSAIARMSEIAAKGGKLIRELEDDPAAL
ncbi:hypothetical protein [Mesorhizobium sp.]|uniref:hypothetical protein n=1 Tax=Mesorhizobium sp. TaxID=1871066 RepID=UPI000FE78751|nr:hypothetical protein [Mesorhizobium sp.]RWD10464.1 MAG: hypothetical protein EOS74_29615 [Mesorhizobium sp.]RWF62977.1 MAG: hypothetical protein EOS47_21050 [Mesorhizobium sp.]